MGKTKVRAPIISPPVLRKVIQKDQSFMCGLCRTDYAHQDHALACLNACWNEVFRSYPLLGKTIRGQGYVYRCIFCSRDYPTEKQGLVCATECKNIANEAHKRELALLSLGDPLPERKPLQFRRQPVTLRPNPKYNLKRTKGPEEPEQVEEAPFEPAVGLESRGTPAESGTGQPAKQEAGSKSKRRHKNSFAKQFIRKGAKYQCFYCNAEYFTRKEVDNCFAGHFDGTDLEIVK